MIQANELRIGNWFTIGTSNPFQITGIFPEYVWALINETDFPVKDLSPIPLTPEWLLRMGFEENDSWTYFKIGLSDDSDFTLRSELEPNTYTLYNILGTDLAIYIRTVHQLQNLYFAMTGSDLTINP